MNLFIKNSIFAAFLSSVSVFNTSAFATENIVCDESVYMNEETHKTFVLFVNGIDNTIQNAAESSCQLARSLGLSSREAQQNSDISYGYFYNHTQGLGDKLELAIQSQWSDSALKAIGIQNVSQIYSRKTDYYHTLGSIYHSLLDKKESLKTELGQLQDKLLNSPAELGRIQRLKAEIEIISTVERLAGYLESVVSAGRFKRVVLVPHSQGNFYVEAAYSLLQYRGKNEVLSRVRVVGAASVAASTPSNTYVSLKQDLAVNVAMKHLGNIASIGQIYQPLQPNYIGCTWGECDGSANSGRLGAINLGRHNFISIYLSDFISHSENKSESLKDLLIGKIHQKLDELRDGFSDSSVSNVSFSEPNKDGILVFRLFGTEFPKNVGVTVRNCSTFTGSLKFISTRELEFSCKIKQYGNQVITVSNFTTLKEFYRDNVNLTSPALIAHDRIWVEPTVGKESQFHIFNTAINYVKSVVWKVGDTIIQTLSSITDVFKHIFEKVGDVTVSATLQDDKEQEITTVSTTINVKPLVCSAGQIIENGKCVDIATLANGESNIALYGDVKKEMISTVKIDDGRTALLVDDVTAIYAAFGLDTRGKGLQDYVSTHINAVISMLKTNGATVNTLVNKPTRNAQGLAHNVVLDADFDSVVKSPADLRKLLLEYFNNKVLSTQLLNVVSTPSTKLRVTLSFWESNGNVFVWASVFPIDKSETVLQLYGDLNSTAAVTTAIKLQSQNNQQDFTQQAANLSGVDILWNVDNSGSMQQEQTNLANGAANFFSKLKATGIDYRLAVNTTDGRQCSLRKLTDGTNRFISSSTLNGENEWSILSRPGTNGSGTETAFYCVRELLEGVGSLAQDKAEFDRPNAKNLVVFVTDEPEIETYQNSKPTGSPSSYVARTFNDYKNFFVSSGATFFSIIEPNSTIVREDFTVSRPLVENCNGQGGSASGGAHFKEISKLTGGSSSSICADADSWSVMFDEVVRAATGLASNFKLSHVPIPSTIKVLVNGRSVLRDTNHAQGFDVVFSDSGAALAFYGNDIPIQNSIIQVEYRYLLN